MQVNSKLQMRMIDDYAIDMGNSDNWSLTERQGPNVRNSHSFYYAGNVLRYS